MEWVIAGLTGYSVLVTYILVDERKSSLRKHGLITRLEAQVRCRNVLMTELGLMLSEIKEDENDELLRTHGQEQDSCGGHDRILPTPQAD